MQEQLNSTIFKLMNNLYNIMLEWYIDRSLIIRFLHKSLNLFQFLLSMLHICGSRKFNLFLFLLRPTFEIVAVRTLTVRPWRPLACKTLLP